MPARGRAWLWWIVSAKFLIALLPFDVPLPVLPALPAGDVVVGALAPAADVWHVDILPALITVWLAGVLVSAYRTVRSWYASEELRRKATHSQQAGVIADCHRLCFYLGIEHCPELLECDDLVNPLLTGVSRPAIILPVAMEEECAIPELRMILAHELAHLKRRDLVLGWVPAIAQIVNWYNPVVAVASREWSIAQEISCDELAVEVTACTAADFGRMVLSMSLANPSACAPAYSHGLSGSDSIDSGEPGGDYGARVAKSARSQIRSFAVGMTGMVRGGPHAMLKRRLCALRYAGERRGPVGWISNRALITLLAIAVIPWHAIPVSDATGAVTSMESRFTSVETDVQHSLNTVHARCVGRVYGCIHSAFGDSNVPADGNALQGATGSTPQNTTQPKSAGNNDVDHQFIYTEN